MINKFFNLLSWLVTGVLLFFTVRRWIFTILALIPDRHQSDRVELEPDWPHVLLLVPVRNEIETLPELMTALDRLTYPTAQLTIGFINDGSTDGSEALLRDRVAGRDHWHLLSLAQNLGKAEALNSALVAFPHGEIVAIYDADERPQPDAVQHLVRPFADERVGGVSGRRVVTNPLAGPAASYTAFESLVHQLVTMRAKNKLDLAPAILGANCAYRRTALTQIGNFKPGALLEDSDLTLKLARAGWQTRFEAGAVSYHTVPETVYGYWQQHTRWTRGFNEVAGEQAPALIFDTSLPPVLRLELLTFALGYIDRLALLGAAGLLFLRRANWPLACTLFLSLVTPFFQILAALKIGREPPSMWRRIIWVPLFFILDLTMAVTGFWNTIMNTPQIWEERRVRG